MPTSFHLPLCSQISASNPLAELLSGFDIRSRPVVFFGSMALRRSGFHTSRLSNVGDDKLSVLCENGAQQGSEEDAESIDKSTLLMPRCFNISGRTEAEFDYLCSGPLLSLFMSELILQSSAVNSRLLLPTPSIRKTTTHLRPAPERLLPSR